MKKLILIFLSIQICNSQIIKDSKTINELVEESTTVVAGKVINKNSYWDVNREMIYTVYKINVSNSFKGKVENIKYAIVKGGVVGSEGLIVKPSIKLSIGNSGYFLLKSSSGINLDGFDFNDDLMLFTPGNQSFYEFDDYTGEINFNNKSSKKVDFENLLTELTKKKSIVVNQGLQKDIFHKVLNSSSALEIYSFSPNTIVAGNSEVLTINGTGFGEFENDSRNGFVSFKNADNGGVGWIDCLKSQIVSWTDDKIQVKVPSDSGTGKFRITRVDNTTLQSSNNLQIPYSLQAFQIGNGDNTIEIPIYHTGSMTNNLSNPNAVVKDNVADGAYVLKFGSNLNSNAEAKSAFETALEDWRCTTGQNFILSDEIINKEDPISDFENVVSFASTDALGVTYQWFDGCYYEGEDRFAWREIDIIFNKDVNWGYENVSNSQYDFNSTAKHEIGHALGFGHNINYQTLMHYASGSGPGTVSIDEYLIGSETLLLRDISTQLCEGIESHSISECSDVTPGQDSDNDGVIDIYDQCPETPIGEAVDEYGCPLSQLDSDDDGVTDDTDECPDTPEGSEVNEIGCADTDEDGVNDNSDNCPNTQIGFDVDVNGCALYEKDSDQDGLTDDIDQCNDTASGAMIDILGCEVFDLPQENFSLTINSISCINSKDGSITFSAKNSAFEYAVLLNDEYIFSLNNNEGFSKTYQNLEIGTYEACFTVTENEFYKQCFVIQILAPDPLLVYDSFNTTTGILELNLFGSNNYKLFHNGNPSTLNQNKTSIRLNRGLNTIKVETDLNCQGFFKKEYFFSNNITLLSNPVNDVLSVQIGGLDEEFNLKIFDIYGKEIRNSSRSLKIDGRIINVNVNDFQSGIYFARFSSKTIKKSIKFIKND